MTICFSNSAVCSHVHATVIEPSERQNEHAGTKDTISFNDWSAPIQSRSFKIDDTNMKSVEKHFKSDKFTKCFEALQSLDNTFQARIQTNMETHSLQQTEAGCLRKRTRSNSCDKIDVTDHPPVFNSSEILNYPEIAFPSIKTIIELVHKVLGSHVPAYYLDIGSGTSAHRVVSASASERLLMCDGIESSPTRFQESRQSLARAQKHGFLKSECRIIGGDIVRSTDIPLQEYNVYSFFDKDCIDISQKVIQKIIIQQSSNRFALGPILYFTCMTSSQLKCAIRELQTKMDPKAWNRLIIDDSGSMIASTEFTSQHFEYTMVHVRERARVHDDALGLEVGIMKQSSQIELGANADRQATVLHCMKERVIEEEMLRETAESKVQTEELELSKVCGESNALYGVHGVKRGRVVTIETVAADSKAIFGQSSCKGKSEFSNLVFTSLSDAIQEWEDAKDAKARMDLLEFNVLATVLKWSEPKKTKGMNS